jgi:hypothetical protein
MAKKEHAEELRRRIATYRRQLAEGVPADTARTYLTEIGKAEAELAKIEQDGDKRRSSIESSSQDVDARVGPGHDAARHFTSIETTSRTSRPPRRSPGRMRRKPWAGSKGLPSCDQATSAAAWPKDGSISPSDRTTV